MRPTPPTPLERPSNVPGQRARAARRAVERLGLALERAGHAGWDPYDALSSPPLAALARTRLMRGAAIQAVKRSPVNLRPLLGVPRQQHTKGLALLASAHAVLAGPGGRGAHRSRALEMGDALAERALPAGGGFGFGYDFDVQTRWAHYRRGEANAIVTCFAVNALIDVAQIGGEDHRYAELIAGARLYVGSALSTASGDERFFSYVEGSMTAIHNANVLVAGMLARSNDGDPDLSELARDAALYSVRRQRPDGSWPYGDSSGLEWVDGYHTAYVLEGLAQVHDHWGGDEVGEALQRGLDFYIDRLFDQDGAPRATVGARFPIDIHASSTAIGTLSRLRALDERALPVAGRVLDWTLANMVRHDGRFAFRLHRHMRNSVPYLRWSDAHMLLALGRYLEAVDAP